MIKHFHPAAHAAGFMAVATSMVALSFSGCATDGSDYRYSQQQRPVTYGQANVMMEGGYDYFPGYEIYYNRSQREYFNRYGSRWVREAAPRGVSVSVLFASPSVHLEFQGTPDRYHRQVIQTYPRNWAPRGSQPLSTRSAYRWDYRERQAGAVMAGTDYDYYPRYEIYYSPSRREYLYRDGRGWVRGPSPRSVRTNLLFASPSVRLEFQDSPDRYHDRVSKQYPKNWGQQGRR